MRSAKSIGRIIGILLFVQLVGLAVGFILLLPIATPGFLENGAGAASQIKAAVLLLFANGALTIGIAIAAFPVFREYSVRVALWFLALSIIWFSMQAVDNIHILSMLSLSQQYTQGGALNAELFGALATAVSSTRRWAHYTELLVIDIWFVVFYIALFRFALVPRVLAGFGLIMVIVHAAGITLPVLVGYSSVLVLAYSMTLSYLVLGTWLVVKGFGEGHRRLRAQAHEVELERG
jgi:Domain of unknown function (DUF4386)